MKVIVNLFLVLAFASPVAARLRSDSRPRRATEDETIPNQYIVVLNEIASKSESGKYDDDDDDVTDRANKLVKQAKEKAHANTNAFEQSNGDPTILEVYDTALKGFAVSNLSDAALEYMLASADVQYIEADQVVQLDTVQSSTPSWGLGRLDDETRKDDFAYSYDFTGSSVVAFVIDTGVFTSHTDFEGRARFGYDATREGLYDGHGHGTHVATTIGGALYGVAKDVTIVAVKVLNSNGSGSYAGVIAGINYVAAQKKASPNTDMVANMSLGGGFSAAVNNAIDAAVAAGVVIAVAAGNSNANACGYSPASAASAITVGATTSSDSRARYSNYGTCVDIFAPGSRITAGWIGGNTATRTISGTSMASPHVAGVAALILNQTPGISPADVVATMKRSATSDVVGGPGSGSPNLLVYTGEISKPDGPPVVAPSASPVIAPVAGPSLSSQFCRTFGVQAGAALAFSATTIRNGDVCAVGALTGVYTLEDGTIDNGSAPTTIDDLSNLLEVAMAFEGTPIAAEIGGKTFTPGIYYYTTITAGVSTIVTLDGRNQPDPVFIFQAITTLATGAGTKFILVNGAKAENILWAVGAAASTGASSVLEGSILAGGAIAIGAGAEVRGCALTVAAAGFGAGSSVKGNTFLSESPAPSVTIAPSAAPVIAPSAAPVIAPVTGPSLSSQFCRTFAVQAGAALSFSTTTIRNGDVCAVAALTGVYTLVDGTIDNGSAPTTIDDLSNLLEVAMAFEGTPIAAEIGGKTFTPGTYYSTTITAGVSTIVTLDGRNQPDPVFIFQAITTLATAASTKFILVNGAKAENILWAVGAAAATGASSVLEGSILAGGAITLGAGAEVRGCVLAVAAAGFGAGSSVNAN